MSESSGGTAVEAKDLPRQSDANQPGSIAAHYGQVFSIDPSIEWQMEYCEQMALVSLTKMLEPECVIEIGSKYGGSLQVFSRFAQRVICLDIDETCEERLGPKYPNAEFVVGPSQETLPPLLAKLQQEDVKVGLMLIDGDHTARGVKGDILALKDYRPACPMFVVMHDCFNPDVRHGVRTARWSENPYVQAVELDFIPGVLHHKDRNFREMWGGFALALLTPQRRTGPVAITAKSEGMQQALYRNSVHHPFDLQGVVGKIGRRARRMLGLKRS